MKDSFSLTQLISVFIRRGRLAITLILVFAFICGGYRGLSLYSKYSIGGTEVAYTTAQEQESYQKALAQYEQEKLVLGSTIENAEQLLKEQLEYNMNSLLMKINPYNEWISSVMLSVEGSLLSDASVREITQNYFVFYNHADLKDNLVDYEHASSEDKYIRELISFEVLDNGLIVLQATGATEEEAAHLANSLVQFLMDNTQNISALTTKHSLSIISWTTRASIDDALISLQQNAQKGIDRQKSAISSYTTQLETLKKPTYDSAVKTITALGLIRSSIKYAVLGGFLGLIIDIVVIFLIIILGNKLEYPSEFEESLSIPFYGLLAEKASVFDRLANAFLHDRKWKTAEEAEQFIRQTSDALFDPSDSIAILSTLPITENDSIVSALSRALSGNGRELKFINSAAANSETALAVCKSSKVFLVERCRKTNRSDVVSVLGLTKAAGKSVSGYVLF